MRHRYSDWRWEVVWQYGPEALTYRLSAETGEVRFLKLAEGELYPGLERESERMRWAIDHLPVPTIVEEGADGEVRWLITRRLPGRDATDRSSAKRPKRLVRALARGLRRFHEAPIDDCPFDFRLDAALAHTGRRLADGQVQPDRDFHEEFAYLTAAEAVRLLEADRPAPDRPVVCHGDYCLPNVMLEDDAVTGFLDLGELGVADRWWDLAVATWSVTWNLGPGLEDEFLRAYGVERDDSRMQYYRLLYDVVS